jgi:heme exporter protein CcmB
MSQALLTVRGVSRAFARRRVLRDVTFDGRRGEVVGLVGPNGAGKSTLLHVLSGRMEPSAGAVRYVGDRAPAVARRTFGVLAHEPQLYGELTARENLSLFARLADVEDCDLVVARALVHARLADRADEPVDRFSRGMRQRLAFERALLHDPEVLLLDEPFTGLDDESVNAMLARLQTLRGSGCCAFVATHDLDVVDGHLDRALLLVGGRLVELPGGVPLRQAYRTALESPDAVAPRVPEPASARGAEAGTADTVARIVRTAALIAGKDLRVEWRHREGLLTTLFFAISCVLVFSFGLVREGQPLPEAGPSVLWVAIAFAGTLAMARTFERERASGTLNALLTSPGAHAGIYLGKWLGLLAVLLAVDVVLLPLVGLFFQMPLTGGLWSVIAVVVAGTAGYAAVGTLFAAMLARTSTRDVLLPVLLYPMTVPIVIGGVRGTAAAISGTGDASTVGMWLALLVCFGAVFTTLSLWTFDTLMTDAAPRTARGD